MDLRRDAESTPEGCGPSVGLEPRETGTARVLRGLARAVIRFPRAFFYPQAVLMVICVFFTVRHLGFSTDRNDLVGSDKAYHRNYLAFLHAFRGENEIVAAVESEDREKNRQFVERLGARLLAETNLFTDILYNNDVKMLGNKALLFFPEDDLRELLSTLQDYRPFLQQFSQATNLVSLFRLVNRQFRTAGRATNATDEPMLQALPALRRIVDQATAALQRPGSPPSPGLTALFDAGPEAEQQVYITFDEGRIYLVVARPRAVELQAAAVLRFRELVELTRLEVPGANAAITGAPVLEYDEMQQSQRDTLVATVVSLVLVSLLFIFGYQESGRPIKAMASLVVGLAYTLAYATWAVGYLNLLTITFVPMLVGLAIDFGVHLVTRYEEELRYGRSEPAALEQAFVHTGRGIFTGCFTTAGAFLAMGLTNFAGVAEMGIICGGGLLVCLVPMMTLLPVLLLRGRQNVLDHQHRDRWTGRERLERLWLDRPYTTLAVGAAVCAGAWYFGRQVGFDYNLLNLQSRDLPAVVLEQKLIRSADRSVLFCAVITDSLEEAVELRRIAGALPTVASADSMAQYLFEAPGNKLELVGQVKEALTNITFLQPDARPVDIADLGSMLWRMGGYLGLAGRIAGREGAEPELIDQLAGLRDAVADLRRTMHDGSEEHSARKLGSYQRALFRDLASTFEALKAQDSSSRMRIEDLPPALRNRFVSVDGRQHLVQVYPRADVWQRENQIRFVGQLRQALDPQGTGRPIITGTPVQLLEYTSLLKDSYEEAAWYALGAIVILVLVHFRSLICLVLALLPVGLGLLWMLGFMGLRGISFNPANIMTLPLVIGIGVTSGIHILNRYAEEQTPSLLAKSTGKAVLVSALTTVAGFGSLVLGKHQGIASLGYVMAVGTATCMVAALTIIPALLTVLARAGWSPRKKTQWRKRELVTGLGGTEVKTSTAA